MFGERVKLIKGSNKKNQKFFCPTSGTDFSRQIPTSGMSGSVGKCQEMSGKVSGKVSGNVGKCREMSVPLVGGTYIGTLWSVW